MKLVEEIFEKATVRGFVDYLLYGLPPESEERNFSARSFICQISSVQ